MLRQWWKVSICLATSSRFCFVCADFIPRFALPTWCAEDHQRSHSAFSLPVTQHQQKESTTFAAVPGKILVLFGLSFGHIINQFLWQVRKIYMDGPALDHMPNPEPRRGPSKSGSTEGEWGAYKAQRKVLLRYLFLLTAPWFLPSILIEMACTCCWALSDCSLTQIRFVYPLPCHYYIESGSVSWFDICTVLP